MNKLPVERLEELNLEHLRLRAEKALSTQGISISRWMMWKEIKRLIDDAIAQQSVTDADVQEAIDRLQEIQRYKKTVGDDGAECALYPDDFTALDLAITALEQYRKPKPDCSAAEWTGGKCCGYCKAENDDEPIDSCKVCSKQASYGEE